jgi:type I restriction enzyme M protein
MITQVKKLSDFIWDIANLLRGDYRQSDYGKVILPFTVLRRLDCILEPNKQAFLSKLEKQKIIFKGKDVPDSVLRKLSGHSFYNLSKFTFKSLLDDSDNIKSNLNNYIGGYSENVRNIMGRFDIEKQIKNLDEKELLYAVLQKFTEKDIDLSPEKISNIEMGYAFEELIRKFSELSNETAGEHFTPREVIELMVNVLFSGEQESKNLTSQGAIFTLYDPACGTGGMLSIADNHLKELNSDITTALFGQELNDESSAICTSDMIIKGQSADNIIFGDTLKNPALEDNKFDYMLCNPPFGVEWKKQEKEVKAEAKDKGYEGRFGAGLPRISDGSLLFLQHMASKMKPQKDGGSRIGIVFNGSPLFSGGAGSGESNIRKWVIENDWLEAIIALPNDLFYNTGIATYIWIVTNRKEARRKGKVQLVNAVNYFDKMRKSLGSKRNYITPEQIEEISKIYGAFEDSENSKIFDNDDFGFERITVEQPLRLRFDITKDNIEKLKEAKTFIGLANSRKKGDAGEKEKIEGEKLQDNIIKILENNIGLSWLDEKTFSKEIKSIFEKANIKLDVKLKKLLGDNLSIRDEKAEIVRDAKGNPKADGNLRDNENVPLKEDIEEYFKREVIPHLPDAWIDDKKQVRGYEIPFTRHFYEYTPPRELEEIETELQLLQKDILELMGDI